MFSLYGGTSSLTLIFLKIILCHLLLLSFRHFHGGTGFLSTQRPTAARFALDSSSRQRSQKFALQYCGYTQAMPALISSAFRLPPRVHHTDSSSVAIRVHHFNAHLIPRDPLSSELSCPLPESLLFLRTVNAVKMDFYLLVSGR